MKKCGNNYRKILCLCLQEMYLVQTVVLAHFQVIWDVFVQLLIKEHMYQEEEEIIKLGEDKKISACFFYL